MKAFWYCLLVVLLVGCSSYTGTGVFWSEIDPPTNILFYNKSRNDSIFLDKDYFIVAKYKGHKNDELVALLESGVKTKSIPLANFESKKEFRSKQPLNNYISSSFFNDRRNFTVSFLNEKNKEIFEPILITITKNRKIKPVKSISVKGDEIDLNILTELELDRIDSVFDNELNQINAVNFNGGVLKDNMVYAFYQKKQIKNQIFNIDPDTYFKTMEDSIGTIAYRMSGYKDSLSIFNDLVKVYNEEIGNPIIIEIKRKLEGNTKGLTNSQINQLAEQLIAQGKASDINGAQKILSSWPGVPDYVNEMIKNNGWATSDIRIDSTRFEKFKYHISDREFYPYKLEHPARSFGYYEYLDNGEFYAKGIADYSFTSLLDKKIEMAKKFGAFLESVKKNIELEGEIQRKRELLQNINDFAAILLLSKQSNSEMKKGLENFKKKIAVQHLNFYKLHLNIQPGDDSFLSLLTTPYREEAEKWYGMIVDKIKQYRPGFINSPFSLREYKKDKKRTMYSIGAGFGKSTDLIPLLRYLRDLDHNLSAEINIELSGKDYIPITTNFGVLHPVNFIKKQIK
jgi:hypothetical protein